MLLMLLLALGVAARDTPEILELTDDVSNDALLADAKTLLPIASRPLYPREPGPHALAPAAALNLSLEHCWIGPPHDAFPKVGRDILEFLSLERK